MKKKLSLLMIVFMAVAAFAIQVGRRAAATTWTVAGNSTELFGSAWDPTATANDMTLDGDVYKWTKTDVALPAFTVVEFKVCGDHAWAVAYPTENYSLTIPENGKYTVEITFNAATEEVKATATKTGDATFPDAEITKVQICGATDASWTNRIDFDLTKGEGNVYTGVLDASAYEDDVEFKLVVNGDTWIGFDQLTMNAPDGWVEKPEGNNNFLLKNSSTRYKSYNITATWVSNALANKGWTVKIEGKEPRTKDVTISPASGDISEAINAELGSNYFAKNVTINLAENGAYTISESIVAGANVVINGAAKAKIDASALTGAGFISYTTVDGPKAMKDETTESAYTIVENVTIKDVEITGLVKPIINNTYGKVLFKTITVDNSVIEITGSFNAFNLGVAYPENLKIENSTIWSNAGHTGFFFKADGKPADITSTSTTTWTVNKSTLVNIAVGKKANNSNGGIKGKKTTTMVLTNSLVYNFGSSVGSEVNGWLWGQNGGANATYANNAYLNAEGTVAGWTDSGKGGSDQTGTSVAGVITFEDAAAGKFNGVLAVDDAVASIPGDPRWTVTQKVNPVDVDVKASDITGGDITAAIAAKAAGKPIKNLSITLAEGNYKVTAPIEACASVSITGATGAKIDASAIEGAGFISYTTVEGAKAMKDETTESAYTIVENVTIKDVEITGLVKPIINNTYGKVLFKTITVDNSVIEITGSFNAFNLGVAYPENLKIENSTIWSNAGHTGFFFKADGKPADITSTSTTTWTVNKSTLVNIAVGKKANNSNGGIKGKKTTTMVLTNSLVYNFGSSVGSEVNGWLWGQNGGANATYANNAYLNAEGTVAGWTDSGKGGSDQTGTSVAGIVTFTDAANGDFNYNFAAAPGSTVPSSIGDPRWTKTDVATYSITVVPTEGMTLTPETNYAAAGNKVYATFTLEDGYEPEMPEFTDTDTGEPIAFTENVDFGMEEVGGVPKVWIIMPAQNLTITLKTAKVSKINLDLSQENGQATCLSVNAEDPTSCYKKEGKEIYLSIIPDAGYEAVISVTCDDADKTVVDVIAEAGDYHGQPYTHKFIMPAQDVTAKVTFRVPTGINGIYVDGEAADIFSDGKPVYNLSGQRVFKGYKGVVIKNGKKIVVK